MTARILTPRMQKRSGVAGGAKHLPKPYKLRRYYTPAEVKVHNNADDCWVTFFNNVYDLTPLIQENYGPLCEPIIKAAGGDITHWFDFKTKEVERALTGSHAQRSARRRDCYSFTVRKGGSCTSLRSSQMPIGTTTSLSHGGMRKPTASGVLPRRLVKSE